MPDAPILLDVSRLIWRQWTRRLPTGIDRVCLAYLQHFHGKAQAVVQFRRFRHILDRGDSIRLFDLLLNGSSHFRSELIGTLAFAAGRTVRAKSGQFYLNVGHTGLNSPQLGPWLASRKLRPVYLIHDLIPITHPQYCREGESERHALRMQTALQSACGLILNSAATQRDVAAFASSRDIVMPTSVVAWLGTDTKPAIVGAAPIERERPYFLMVGTIEARKNHLAMLEVWRQIVTELGDDAPDLIVIGQRGWEAAEAIAILDDAGQLRSHVHEMGSCSDDRMAGLLAGARAMLMPSFVEGFGLPLVEALQKAIPVIASDLPVFREIAGDIPTYLDPTDRASWAKVVIDYLENGRERQRQLAKLADYRAPNWNDHFALAEEFLETLS